MAKIVVADTGPLIALALIDLLPILPSLFLEVYIPDAVAGEAIKDPGKPGALVIAEALKNGNLQRRFTKLDGNLEELSYLLDQGEAEAIALAAEPGAVVLIDERRGRKVAASRGIEITGTAAVLVSARLNGHIDPLGPHLETLSQSGYRLSRSLIDAVLEKCGE
jgi:predicted nucleic acid-binding protein